MKILLNTIVFIIIPIILHANIILVKNNTDKIIGVQIFYISEKYKDNLDKYFYTLKQKGVNTVFIRVFQNKGDRYHYNVTSLCESGVYFKTDQACMIYDILPEFIKYGKKYHIKIFAWMGTRKLSFLVDKFGVADTFRLNENEKRKGYGVDIFNPVVFKKLRKIFIDLAKYEIDGILLQDDFILRIDESSSFYTTKNFLTDYDIYVDNSYNIKDLPEDFFEWKTKALSDIINYIKWDMKKINPKIKFAVNIYYETLFSSKKGKRWYGQSIENYHKKGFTYFASMLYSEQIKSEMKFSNEDYLKFLNNVLNFWTKRFEPPYRFIAKLQIRYFKNKNYIDKKFYNNICGLINKYNVSYILVPFEQLDDLDYLCN